MKSLTDSLKFEPHTHYIYTNTDTHVNEAKVPCIWDCILCYAASYFVFCILYAGPGTVVIVSISFSCCVFLRTILAAYSSFCCCFFFVFCFCAFHFAPHCLRFKLLCLLCMWCVPCALVWGICFRIQNEIVRCVWFVYVHTEPSTQLGFQMNAR